MLNRVISKVVGPKVVIGMLATFAAITIFLAYRVIDISADLRDAEQGLVQASATIAAQQQEMAEYEAAVEAQREREQAARERAAQAERQLQDLEQSDEEVQDWSDARVPDGVRDWLREPEGSD